VQHLAFLQQLAENMMLQDEPAPPDLKESDLHLHQTPVPEEEQFHDQMNPWL
jgi:hypothetical protein